MRSQFIECTIIFLPLFRIAVSDDWFLWLRSELFAWDSICRIDFLIRRIKFIAETCWDNLHGHSTVRIPDKLVQDRLRLKWMTEEILIWRFNKFVRRSMRVRYFYVYVFVTLPATIKYCHMNEFYERYFIISCFNSFSLEDIDKNIYCVLFFQIINIYILVC